MASFDYEKGFVGGLKVSPVAHDECRVGRAPAVHAQVTEEFEFGEFTCQRWGLLCGSPARTTLYEYEGSINEVSCSRCKALLNRWSRDSINARCSGHVITRAGVTRAVAAKSVLFAGELLGVNHQLLARHGHVKIDLSEEHAEDGHDEIRALLTGSDYGTVFERREDETGWIVIKPASEAEVELLKRKLGESARGNTAKLGQVRQNRLVRLTEAEILSLKSLGGATWLRSELAKAVLPAPKAHVSLSSDAPLKGFTLRATDEEWEKLLRLGGTPWVRALVCANSDC